MFDDFNWASFWETCVSWITSAGIKIVIALILLIVGFALVNFITKRIYKMMIKAKADLTLSKVMHSALKSGLKIIIAVSLIGYLGIETASISALIASVGLGVSMAVQGTLGNFAGGLLLIVMRPFKVGDFITSGEASGTVEDIGLFYTQVATPDNKLTYIPNGTLSNNVIVNVTAKDTRRVEVVMSVSYSTDIEKAKSIIRQVCVDNSMILATPAPFIEVGTYADSSIDIIVRTWCATGDYWTVYFYLLAEIKKAFDANGIEVPFNQLDVYIKQ